MWARFSGQFNRCPQVIDAGPLATALHMHAVIHACQYDTNGFISEQVADSLVRWEQDAADFICDIPNNKQLATKLVDVGLWEATDGGWRIVDIDNAKSGRA